MGADTAEAWKGPQRGLGEAWEGARLHELSQKTYQ